MRIIQSKLGLWIWRCQINNTAMIKKILRAALGIKVVHLGRSSSTNKLIITPNHQSFLDAVYLYLSLPIKPVFLVNKQIAQIWYFD